MHESVEEAEEEDEPAGHFMEVNVLVNGHEGRGSASPEVSQTLSQHHNNDKSTIEIETLAWKRKKTNQGPSPLLELVYFGKWNYKIDITSRFGYHKRDFGIGMISTENESSGHEENDIREEEGGEPEDVDIIIF
jgi:hypothetical protein